MRGYCGRAAFAAADIVALAAKSVLSHTAATSSAVKNDRAAADCSAAGLSVDTWFAERSGDAGSCMGSCGAAAAEASGSICWSAAGCVDCCSAVCRGRACDSSSSCTGTCCCSWACARGAAGIAVLRPCVSLPVCSQPLPGAACCTDRTGTMWLLSAMWLTGASVLATGGAGCSRLKGTLGSTLEGACRSGGACWRPVSTPDESTRPTGVPRTAV
jgi:hypothetical protein